MTHIGFISPDQLNRASIQLVKVVARVCDLPRFESQPAHYLQYALKVYRLFCLRVRVIVPQIAPSAMMRRVPQVDKYGLGVPDMQESIRLWWKARIHQPTSSFEVCVPQRSGNLWILTRFV
jgi:hypothetical protein